MLTSDMSPAIAPEASKQSLAVIIPTLNEIAYLPGLLDALRTQTHLPDEVLVADAGSTDGTADLARMRDIRLIPGGMPAVARNAGAHAAGGDLLLFLDADVLPPPDFIALILEEFERKEYDVATCLITALDENPLDRVICKGTNLYFRIMQPVSPHAPGFCILSRRTAHESIGGFDESLTLSEDTDYVRRAKRFGKIGILTSTRIPVSMRRVGKEGLFRLGLKYAWCEVYALIGKPVRAAPFEYQFGAFSPCQSSTDWVFIKTFTSLGQRMQFWIPLLKFGRNIWGRFNL